MVKGSRWVLVLLLALLSQGCSFMFVDGPPDRHEKMLYFDCTSTAGPEVVDVTYAALMGVAAAGSLDDGNGDGGTTVLLASAGLFGASAVYGIVKTQACNEAKDALRIRLMKIFAREAQLRAAEEARERPRALRDVLTHPKRLPKRKKHRKVEPPPAEALPPPPPPPEGELPPAPPPPPAAAPPPAAPPSSVSPPAPAAPPTSAFPVAPAPPSTTLPPAPPAPPQAPAPVR